MGWSVLLSVIMIGIASNLDNLGVGLSYGTLGITIPPLPNLLIALIACIETLLTVTAGQAIAVLLPPLAADALGAVVIISVGIWILVGRDNGSKGGLGRILRDPASADRDRSRSISLGEALILGQALALNNVAQGVGAGLIGLPPVAVALSGACFSYASTWGGAACGRMLGAHWLGSWSRQAAGVLLILVGLNQLPLGSWL